MEKKNAIDDIHMFGISPEAYADLLQIAKTEGKAVTEVTSDALREYMERKKQLQESRQKKLLMEG